MKVKLDLGSTKTTLGELPVGHLFTIGLDAPNELFLKVSINDFMRLPTEYRSVEIISIRNPCCVVREYGPLTFEFKG